MSIDKHNSNNKWAEAIKLEIDHQHEYDTCKDIGKGPPFKVHKKIRTNFVFDEKDDGMHKARLVADVHLTDVPLSSLHSGVASGIRLVLFQAKLNGLESWGTYIRNTFLESFKK